MTPRCSHAGCRDGRSVARYFRPATSFTPSRTALLCADCVRRDNALSETWRLDARVDPDRPYKGREHRRSWRPAWMVRDAARDLTGASR